MPNPPDLGELETDYVGPDLIHPSPLATHPGQPDVAEPGADTQVDDTSPWAAALRAVASGAAAAPSGMARSTSGVTGAGLKQGYSVIDKAKAEARGEFNAIAPEYADQEARASQHFADLAQSVTDMGQKEGEHYANLLGLQKRVSDFHETAAQAEAQIYESAKQERAGYLTAYREQLAGVRAMAATTGNPLGGLTSSQGLAMAAAQFAQGFLGAQGIHIDVSGQIDKWIDRSIQEHQMKINNLRESANDELHLYDIAKQTSEDDWEARQRFRGFVLAGFQSQIEAEGSRFQSGIASERAKQKSAELQLELDKVYISIGDRRQARYEQIEKRKLEEVTILGTLAHQKEMERIGWAQAANARAKATKPKEYKTVTDIERRSGYAPDFKPMTDAKGNILKDSKGNAIPAPTVGKVDQPVNTWHFDPEDKEGYHKAQDAKIVWDSYNHRWDEVTKLRQEAYEELDQMGVLGKAVKGNAMGLAERASPKFREFMASYWEFIRAQLKQESGQVVTNQEVETKMKQYPMEKLFQSGDSAMQTFMDMRETKRADFEGAQETYSIEGQAGEKKKASPQKANQFKISQQDNGPQTTPLQAEEAQAREGSSSAADQASSMAYEGWKRQASEMNPNRQFGMHQETEFATHLDTMAQIAIDPTEWSKRTGEGARDLQEQALRRLEAIGRDTSITTDRREYAQYLAGRIIDDPEGLAAQLKQSSDDPDRLKFH